MSRGLEVGGGGAGRAVLARNFVWDNHTCMPLRPGDNSFLPQLSRARASGCSAVTINIGFGEQRPIDHLRMLAGFRSWLKARPDDFLLVQTTADFDRAREGGQLGVVFDIEGARAIEDDLALLGLYRDLGVGWMLIAYNRANLAGSGCYDPVDTGLTDFGRAMIAEMERVGITLCLTHTGERTARDAIAVATRPFIFSHSNCAAVYPHARNISDALIRECAEHGGVVGMNGLGDFLGPAGSDLIDAYVAHVDHAVQLVGPAHVGIALDYVYDQDELRQFLATMPETFPDGLPDHLPLVPPEALVTIIERLLILGYSEADLAMLLGDNWRRVAHATWDAPNAH